MTDEPKRQTPTEFARALAMAAVTRSPVTKTPSAEVGRNAKGDWTFEVAGTQGEDESLAECALRVLGIALDLDGKLPLSRAQHFGRDYLPNEKDAVKRKAKT